jgi:peroxiredoxin (alkyl hydroperoxide reductase subunit C)
MPENNDLVLPFINKQLPNIGFDYYQNNKFFKTHLADYQGKWLLLFFYPADFTFVCPTELEDLANFYDQFVQAGAEIISFSTDTKFTHLAWQQSSTAIGKIKFPMGADPTGNLSRSLGVYISEEGMSLRASFIIDPTGKIKAYEVHDNSIGRSAKELLRKLQSAIYVSEHQGEVCPANWHPGEKTLTPSENLVGKI